MRIDKREPGQLRPVSVTIDYLLTAEGSVLIEVGNTRVLCAASIEETVPSFLRNTGKGWVTAEYSMLPRATATRTARSSGSAQRGAYNQEGAAPAGLQLTRPSSQLTKADAHSR